jgi:hypothetical protein
VAFAMSMVCRDYAVKAAVPLVFLLALVPAAHISGRMAGLACAIIASFIFSVWLFEPYGSVVIRSTVDRIELLCFGLAALGVFCFSPDPTKTATGNVPVSFDCRVNLEAWIVTVGYVIVPMALVTLLLYMWN